MSFIVKELCASKDASFVSFKSRKTGRDYKLEFTGVDYIIQTTGLFVSANSRTHALCLIELLDTR